MAKGPRNQAAPAANPYLPGSNPIYGATPTMPSPALMPSAQNPAQYDVGGGLKSTVKPVLDKWGLPTITPEMQAAAKAPIPGTRDALAGAMAPVQNYGILGNYMLGAIDRSQ